MKKTLLLILLMLGAWTLHAQVPGTLSFQGILVDNTGAPVSNGNHFVQFHFYTTSTGGSAVYSSTGTGTGNTVTTFNGLFTFVIGSGSAGNVAIPSTIFNQQLYVELIADNVTLTPRIPLTTVAYSNVAESANSMDAADLTGSVADARLSAHLQDLADGTLTGSKVGTGIDAGNISTGTLAIARIADGTVTNAKLASGIDAVKITGTVAVANGGTGAATAAAARTNLGVAIGTDVQAFDADLSDLADGSLSGSKVGTGINATNITTNTVALANGGTGASTAAAARTNLGVVIDTDVQAFDADLTDLADGSLSGSKVGTGIDAANITTNTVAVANGGTGAATAAAARTNLGVAIGTDVQAFDADLTDLADGSLSGSKVGTGIDAGNISAGTLPVTRGGSGATTLTGAVVGNGTGAFTAVTHSAGSQYMRRNAGNTAYEFGALSLSTGEIADDAVTVAKIGSAGAADANKILTTDGSGNPQWSTASSTNIPTGTGQNGLVSFWSGTNTQSSNANLYWDNANSRLGLGTPSPNRRLTISGTGGVENDILVESFVSTAAGSGTLRFTKAEGTSSTPTTVLANDYMGSIAFAGYTGATYSNAGQILGQAETSFNTAVNGALTFNTAAAGTLSEKMRLTSTGSLGLGTTSPNTGLIHLAGTTTSYNGIHFTTTASGATATDGFLVGPSASNSNDLILWNYEAANLVLGTNGTGRLTINSAGNIGVGTAPASKFDVEGGAVIGATYAGTNAAPTNGLLVEGNVGIGNTTASYPLSVHSATNTRGANIELDYSGAAVQYGLSLDLSAATGTSTKYGIQNSVSGTAANASSNYGLYNAMVPNGTGNVYGTQTTISNVGTGGRWGAQHTITGSNTNVNTIYGVENNITTNGNSTVYGTYNYLTNAGTAGTGTRYGTYNQVYGLSGAANSIYGEYNYVYHSGTGATYGIRNDVNKISGQAGDLYGLSVESDNDGTGNSYLMYANSVGATTGTEYGLYVTGEDVNYFSNKVGMGTSNLTTIGTDRLYVNGTVRASGYNTISDSRFKKDIKPLNGSLSKIKTFRGVSYNWRVDEFKDRDFTNERQIGFIAQEVEKVFPELVSTSTDGYKAVNYGGMSAVLLEAIKEQQAQIEELKAQVEQYKNLSDEFAELKKLVSAQLKSQPAETQSTGSVGSKKK